MCVATHLSATPTAGTHWGNYSPVALSFPLHANYNYWPSVARVIANYQGNKI
jgi:hypothetical protein